MMLLAKVAIGLGTTLVMAGAYTMREGVIKIDIDEHCSGGSHVHLWVPAAAVPMALHFAPKQDLRQAAREAGPYLPTMRTLTKELVKYPEATFVDVQGPDQHVRIQTHNGKLQIDVHDNGDTVHLLCPLAVLDDFSSELASYSPGA
jgi:hypothetical protein